MSNSNSRLKGKRVMITVPEDVMPDLQAFADHLELPVATAVRLLISEMHGTLKTINLGLAQVKRGTLSGLTNFTAIMAAAQADMLQLNADAMKDMTKLVADVANKDEPKT